MPHDTICGYKGAGKGRNFRNYVLFGQRKHAIYVHMWAGKERSIGNHGHACSARRGDPARMSYMSTCGQGVSYMKPVKTEF